MRSGFRTTFGMWLDDCHSWDVEFDYLSLGERSNEFSMFSTGFPILARPFFNVQTNAQASELVAYPGTVRGNRRGQCQDLLSGRRRNVQPQSMLLQFVLRIVRLGCEETCGGAATCCPPLLHCCRTDLLVGFRYYNLSDFVGVTENLRVTQPGPSQDTTIASQRQLPRPQRFLRERNRLAHADLSRPMVVGNPDEDRDGQQPSDHHHRRPNHHYAAGRIDARLYDAGILAGGTNSGVYQRDQFTVIPQLGLELGYQVSCHWRAYLGYDLLYWGAVAQAADQIDLNLDPRNFPPITPTGPALPAVPRQDRFLLGAGHPPGPGAPLLSGLRAIPSPFARGRNDTSPLPLGEGQGEGFAANEHVGVAVALPPQFSLVRQYGDK